jgi:hypothetical protein
MPPPSDLTRVEELARAAAATLGIEVDEAWWPSVAGHLNALLARAATLDAVGVELPEDSAAVFEP